MRNAADDIYFRGERQDLEEMAGQPDRQWLQMGRQPGAGALRQTAGAGWS